MVFGTVVSKRLQILREFLPKAERVAVLVNPSNAANTETTLREIGQAALPLGLQVQVLRASSGAELNSVFRTLADQRPDAVFVGGDPFLNTLRAELASLAAYYAIPASYAVRDYVEAGGLMSYGPSIHHMFRQVGIYAGRILKGEKPSDLPVVQSVKIELVINLKT